MLDFVTLAGTIFAVIICILLILIAKILMEIKETIEEAFGLWSILQTAEENAADSDKDIKRQLAERHIALHAEDDDPDREDPDIRRMKQENRGFYS